MVLFTGRSSGLRFPAVRMLQRHLVRFPRGYPCGLLRFLAVRTQRHHTEFRHLRAQLEPRGSTSRLYQENNTNVGIGRTSTFALYRYSSSTTQLHMSLGDGMHGAKWHGARSAPSGPHGARGEALRHGAKETPFPNVPTRNLENELARVATT